MPREKPPAFLPATSLSPTSRSTSSTRDRAIPFDAAIHCRCARAERFGCTHFASSSAPTVRSGWLCCAYGLPCTSASPLVGRSSPSIIRMVVDLPAPFGPRNPVTRPGGTVNVRSSTAFVSPKCLVSPLASIMTPRYRCAAPRQRSRDRDNSPLPGERSDGGMHCARGLSRSPGSTPAPRIASGCARRGGPGDPPARRRPSPRAISAGSSARETALASSTASQPSSIASAASRGGADAGVEDHRHARLRRRSSRCCTGCGCPARCRSASRAASPPRSRRPPAGGRGSGRRWCRAAR